MRLHPKDNVGLALTEVKKYSNFENTVALVTIPAGHKIALNEIKAGEPIKTKGLIFMDSPGYDPVSVTGQVASGANVVCFTTGRGSVFGCKPVPCLKLATNSPMYNRMIEDMDLNCGEIIDGTMDVQEMGSIIFQKILATASGELTKSEEFGFGDYEFTPWKIGAVL